MNLIPWKREARGEAQPLDLFRRQMDGLFEDFFGEWSLAGRAGSFVPRIDVSEDEKHVVVRAELPGVDQNEVEVSLSGGRLVISGEKKSGREEQKRNYHLVERSYGSFSRAVDLGDAVDSERAAASYKDGVLTVTVPKAEAAKPKKISVKVD
jgi:HSP20 family protein